LPKKPQIIFAASSRSPKESTTIIRIARKPRSHCGRLTSIGGRINNNNQNCPADLPKNAQIIFAASPRSPKESTIIIRIAQKIRNHFGRLASIGQNKNMYRVVKMWKNRVDSPGKKLDPDAPKRSKVEKARLPRRPRHKKDRP
jgi:hypothetical protein